MEGTRADRDVCLSGSGQSRRFGRGQCGKRGGGDGRNCNCRRNVAIAKGFINRFDEIPPLLDPLLGSRKYEEAAELLRRYVRSDVRTDGVLLCPERDIFALLVNTDEPDIAAVRKMLSQRSAELQREYLAAKQSLDHPSRDIALQLDEAIKAIAQIVTDA